MKKNPKRNQPNRHPSHEELGKMLVNIYESGYLDRSTAYKTSFVKGIFSGLGGVIGATIVVGLLVWSLTLFQRVPLIGRLVDSIKSSVKTEPR